MIDLSLHYRLRLLYNFLRMNLKSRECSIFRIHGYSIFNLATSERVCNYKTSHSVIKRPLTGPQLMRLSSTINSRLNSTTCKRYLIDSLTYLCQRSSANKHQTGQISSSSMTQIKMVYLSKTI